MRQAGALQGIHNGIREGPEGSQREGSKRVAWGSGRGQAVILGIREGSVRQGIRDGAGGALVREGSGRGPGDPEWVAGDPGWCREGPWRSVMGQGGVHGIREEGMNHGDPGGGLGIQERSGRGHGRRAGVWPLGSTNEV